MAEVLELPRGVAEVEADLQAAKRELERLVVAIDEAQSDFDRAGTVKTQHRRDELRRQHERAAVRLRHLVDELAGAQRAALVERRAGLLRERDEVRAEGAATAERFQEKFLEARSELWAFARARAQSRDLERDLWFLEGELQGERRPGLAAFGCIALPQHLKGWVMELVEVVDQTSRSSTA
jgi:hypothetical protein